MTNPRLVKVAANARADWSARIDKFGKERPEAFSSAQEIYDLFQKHRFVCACAETQMGKTTICRLLAKKWLLDLDDEIAGSMDNKIIVYIENVANNDLATQAEENFSHLETHVKVVSITKAENYLLEMNPKTESLFIIDESHMGSDQLAKRLSNVLAVIEERSNRNDRILLVSATGFSSIYEASRERSIMGYSAAINVVKQPTAYRGISSFIKNDQVIDNSVATCLLEAKTVTPDTYIRFIETLYGDEGGLHIIRSSANRSQETLEHLLSLIDPETGAPALLPQNIKIVASSLNDVDQSELTAWSNVLSQYQNYRIRGEKLVIIVRGFLRVGIAMHEEMKAELMSTWDGTSSAVSSVVQALIGRACGYHNNTKVLHFANKRMLEAHTELSEKLNLLSKDSEVTLNNLALAIDNITTKYGVKNWDPGLAGIDSDRKVSAAEKRTKEAQFKVRNFAAYSFDPLTEQKSKDDHFDEGITKELAQQLHGAEVDLSDQKIKLTQLLLKVHKEYHTIRGEVRRKSRQLRGIPFAYGQFINRNTFLKPEHGNRKALERAMSELMREDGKPVSFNGLKKQGGGERNIENVDYVVYVVSSYNSTQKSPKESLEDTILSEATVRNFCKTYDIKENNTVVILFSKGERYTELERQLKLDFEKAQARKKKSGNVVPTSVYTVEHEKEII
ncbi:DEAD/DEAH box helicase family protein [Enterovibrio sp. FF113]|uniref:DEAD/DEAH box helicase family protein n=1 Tax=Enterovibrio sp. FF113 TaxID=3230010 RepID=UPI00352C5CDF